MVQAAHNRVAGPLTAAEVTVVGEALRWLPKSKAWPFICMYMLPYRQPSSASARWKAHERAALSGPASQPAARALPTFAQITQQCQGDHIVHRTCLFSDSHLLEAGAAAKIVHRIVLVGNSSH